jgi:ribosomal subunit interface protein
MRSETSSAARGGAGMQVVLTGRNMAMSAGDRRHVADKIVRLDRYSNNIIRYGFDFYHENNSRQSKLWQRVTITGRGNGSRAHAESETHLPRDARHGDPHTGTAATS